MYEGSFVIPRLPAVLPLGMQGGGSVVVPAAVNVQLAADGPSRVCQAGAWGATALDLGYAPIAGL
jgi:hypothetical protein